MSKQIVIDPLFSAEFYRCDICQRGYLTRVLTDSYTELDICFDCASGPSDHGLFWTVTQSPEEDGDNLVEETRRLGLLEEEPEDDDEEDDD